MSSLVVNTEGGSKRFPLFLSYGLCKVGEDSAISNSSYFVKNSCNMEVIVIK